MYCNFDQVDKIMLNAMTTANPVNTGLAPAKLSQIGTQPSTVLFTPDLVRYHIQMSDAKIDSVLSQQYATPLTQMVHGATQLTADLLSEYSDTLYVADSTFFVIGDTIFLTDGTNSEMLEVATVSISEITTTTVPANSYYTGTRILKIQYPDPIPFCSAMLTSASLCDKYFGSQTEPGKSEFGEKLRGQAMQIINDIREGRIILEGQKRIGWRFANPNLLDRYTLKGSAEQDSTRSNQDKT